MNDCERFIEILAGGEGVAPADRAWAQAHAAGCPACETAARVFGAFEAAAAVAAVAPPGTVDRVLTALREERRRARVLPRRPGVTFPGVMWVAGLFAAAAAVTGAVWVWIRSAGTFDLASLVSGDGLTVTLEHIFNGAGILAGVAASLGALGYYYLVPRR
jgi:hypothetical protein